jgi:hypothetical protein
VLPQNDEIYEKIKFKYGAAAVRSSEATIMIDELVPSLAKIAHSFAVAIYGVDRMIPFLIDIILGNPTTVPPPFLIGGLEDGDSLPETPENSLHELRHILHQSEGDELIVVFISLFHQVSFPTYQVVVGAHRPEPAIPSP